MPGLVTATELKWKTMEDMEDFQLLCELLKNNATETRVLNLESLLD